MNRSTLHRLTWKQILVHLLTKDRLFQLGLLLKVLFSIFFASEFLTELFAPFIKAAINGNYLEVYTNMYATKPNAFPYPPVMLYILSIPRFIAALFVGADGPVSFIDLLCIRIPLIMADFFIVFVLVRWLRNLKDVVKWYWFNPIIFYISYIHGQLDIIPTALLCLSLYYLFTNRMTAFVVLLALACATKFHIIMAIPIIAIYLFRTRKVSFGYILKLGIAFITLLLVLNLPYLLQSEFVQMVYNNREQNKVLASFFNVFSYYKIFFIPATYMMILYLMIDFRFINRDVLLIFLALSFGAVTFFIVPSQGWYLWNMPFFIYFLIRFGFNAKPVFVAMNIGYFLFFIIYPLSDFPRVAQVFAPLVRTWPNVYQWLELHGIRAEVLLQLVFTVLQTTLLLFCISIFRMGVLQIRKYKIYHQPYLIGICGDSGSGKSTLADGITQLFGDANTLTVRGDDMHRWERGHEKWNELTHLNPKANWLHRDLSNLIDLRAGKRIKRRSYDHDTGKFTELQTVEASRVIIYEGLHSFYLQQSTTIYDLKIFMMPSEALRRMWKIERDVKKRGHTPDKVIESIEKRMSDSLSHILNQQNKADIIFSIIESPTNKTEAMDDESNFALKVTCTNDIYFEGLIDSLKMTGGVHIQHDIDRDKQEMIVDGLMPALKLKDVAATLQLEIEEIVGTAPHWRDNYLGIMQLFVLYAMLTQFKRTGMMVESETL